MPEVETVRRDLREKICDQKIAAVQILEPKIVQNCADEFRENLVGNFFVEIWRRGKLLIFELRKPKKFLLAHLKMTGQFFWRGHGEFFGGGHGEKFFEKSTRAIFKFKNSSELFFADARKFGFLRIVDEKNLQKILANFGAEILNCGAEKFSRELNFRDFQKILRPKKNVKSFLLDQKILAGIGNIYADEILFAAGVSPFLKIENLSKKTVRKIFDATKKILQSAVENRGTTFNSFRDTRGKIGNFQKFLQIYGRAKKKCRRCAAILQKTKIAGRGTTFCANCQK